MSFVNMREMELEMGSKRTRPYDETEADESNKRLKSEECIQLRLLLVGKMSNIGYLQEFGRFPHVFQLKIKRSIKLSLTNNVDYDQPVNLIEYSSIKDCGALIGKTGSNIQRLRDENQVIIKGLNTRTIDRVLSLDGDKENVKNVIKEILSVCSKGPYPASNQGHNLFELNLLVNSESVGLIIGKGGAKIKEIADVSGGKLKVYPDCMPNSNERVIAVGGDDETKIVSALDMILSLLSTSPRQHQTSQYDPGSVGKPSFGTVGNTSNIAFGSGSMSGVGSGILGQGISANVAVTHLEVANILIRMRDNNSKNVADPSKDFSKVNTETKLVVPHDMCGAIIGKAGQNIRYVRQASGAQINFSEGNKESKEDRIITITGAQEQVQIAEQLMTQCAQNR